MSHIKIKNEPKYEIPGSAPVFQTAIFECPEINASTMAVDASGRFALISGRKGMGLIDLDGDSDDCAKRGIASSQTMSSSALTPTDITNRPKNGPSCKLFGRNSKYEPTSSHFNRHLVDLYALSTFQVVEIFSIDHINPSRPKFTLRGHSRAIADIEWSPFDPNMLGSSAADCLTNLWDIRDPRRPSTCLTSVSGATQVRFSKTSSNLIATSHEIDIRLWDIRQPNLPINYIAAHLQKINGMDWSPNRRGCDHEQLITCSQDNTIKLWDLTASKIRPSANLPTRTPAWRVRYTPASPYAILTSTLPQLRSRTECMALKLWSMKSGRYEQKKLELILGLVGHTDVVIDFDWRQQASSSGACEIVSWSKDQTLRVWRVDNQFIEMNVENSDYEPESDNQTPSNHTHDTSGLSKDDSIIPKLSMPLVSERQLPEISAQDRLISSEQQLNAGDNINRDDVRDESEQEDSVSENSSSMIKLRQEFNLINKNIPNIEFEELNSLRRVCLVIARSKNVTCRLRIALPPSYPHKDCPTFTIIDSNQFGTENLGVDAKEKLIALLNETAKVQLNRGHNCVEPCLRKFIITLQKLTSHTSNKRKGLGSSTGSQNGNGDYKDDPITLSAQRDHSVPFPATSGARFCGNLLVCFGRPILPTLNSINRGSGSNATSYSIETPRSMAQLSAQLDNMRRQGSYNLSNISISYFYYGAMRRAELQSRTSATGMRSSITSGIGSSSRASSGSSSTSKYLSNRNRTSALGAHFMLAKNFKCGPVIIYDVSSILGGISKELAEDYVFDKDVIKMCRRNAEIALAHNRRDLVQVWSLAELSSEGVLRSYIPSLTTENHDGEGCLPLMPLMNMNDSDFGDRPWTMHPFGSKLIQSLIDHYVYNCHDVQTAAMLVWTFSSPRLGRQIRNGVQHSLKLTSSTSLSNTALSTRGGKTYSEALSNNTNKMVSCLLQSANTAITGQNDTTLDEWSFVNEPETHLYSNSWSNSTFVEEDTSWCENEAGMSNRNLAATSDEQPGSHRNGDMLEKCFPKLNILSPDRSLQNDLIMHIYAEHLYRLNLLNQRAMVLKNIGSNSAYSEIFGDKQTLLSDTPESKLPNLAIQCSNLSCRSKCRSVQCNDCKRYSFYCSICRLPVRGSCSICLKCLHGGHVNHFSAWFNSYDFCPTGCGCKCPLVSQGC